MRLLKRHWRRLLFGIGGSVLAGAAMSRARSQRRTVDIDTGPIIEEIPWRQKLLDKRPRRRPKSSGGNGGIGTTTPQTTTTRTTSTRTRGAERDDKPVTRRDVSKDVARQREEAKQAARREQQRDDTGPEFGIGRGIGHNPKN